MLFNSTNRYQYFLAKRLQYSRGFLPFNFQGYWIPPQILLYLTLSLEATLDAWHKALKIARKEIRRRPGHQRTLT